MFYPVLRSIKFVHAIQSLYNRGCISVKMSATPLSKQNSQEVKVIIRCVVKGYQECLFDVDIGEKFEIKSKIGSKGRAFKLCNNRGQLGHLQPELVAPLWPLARQLSSSKWYVNLPSHIFIHFFLSHVFPAGSILAEYFCKISGITSTFNCFLPLSIVTGKPFDDQKGRWKKGGGINVPVSLELLLAAGEAKKLTTEIKVLVIWCQVIPG